MPRLMHRRRVLKQLITYIGLDVHKDTIAVALAEAGLRGEVREYGKIANTPIAVKTLAAKLSRNGHELRFCYEARPCGYGIQRQLTVSEHDCMVVAPSRAGPVTGSRPTGGMRSISPNCIGLVNLRRFGFPMRRVRRSAIWCGHVRRQYGCRVRRVNNCPASCCAMAVTTTDRHGH